MYIRQISVFLENARGTLRELTELLAENDINLLALSIADTAGFGIVRIIVKYDQIDPALAVLRQAGHVAKVNRVICLNVPHRPGGLSGILALMEDAGINLEYTYSFVHSAGSGAVLVLRPSDTDACIELFEKNHVEMISQEQVDQAF